MNDGYGSVRYCTQTTLQFNSIFAMFSKSPCFYVILLVVLIRCQYVVGFAAWLKCYVDITDTEEIIMNYLILPKDQGQHGEVLIEVKGVDDDHWVTEDFSFDPTRTTSVMVRLKVPPTLAEVDVQFVMDILPNDGITNDSVIFTRPANVCKGKRAHATHYTESVILQISSTGEDDIPSPVRLIAVYATGHEAVTQTDIMTLHPNSVEEEEL
jgi:hypothetical protein